jgi:hypothetical protein
MACAYNYAIIFFHKFTPQNRKGAAKSQKKIGKLYQNIELFWSPHGHCSPRFASAKRARSSFLFRQLLAGDVPLHHFNPGFAGLSGKGINIYFLRLCGILRFRGINGLRTIS